MPHKVQVIDDEWAVTEALVARLNASGFETHASPDGAAGIEEARTFGPDVILLDLRMPDMDGFEVLRRLRADPALAAIPVIVLSANVQDSARQLALASGAARFFSKPYLAADLVDAIHGVIEAASNKTRAAA
jgi:CheY-like chemotaxis protein